MLLVSCLILFFYNKVHEYGNSSQIDKLFKILCFTLKIYNTDVKHYRIFAEKCDSKKEVSSR